MIISQEPSLPFHQNQINIFDTITLEWGCQISSWPSPISSVCWLWLLIMHIRLKLLTVMVWLDAPRLNKFAWNDSVNWILNIHHTSDCCCCCCCGGCVMCSPGPWLMVTMMTNTVSTPHPGPWTPDCDSPRVNYKLRNGVTPCQGKQ